MLQCKKFQVQACMKVSSWNHKLHTHSAQGLLTNIGDDDFHFYHILTNHAASVPPAAEAQSPVHLYPFERNWKLLVSDFRNSRFRSFALDVDPNFWGGGGTGMKFAKMKCRVDAMSSATWKQTFKEKIFFVSTQPRTHPSDGFQKFRNRNELLFGGSVFRRCVNEQRKMCCTPAKCNDFCPKNSPTKSQLAVWWPLQYVTPPLFLIDKYHSRQQQLALELIYFVLGKWQISFYFFESDKLGPICCFFCSHTSHMSPLSFTFTRTGGMCDMTWCICRFAFRNCFRK